MVGHMQLKLWKMKLWMRGENCKHNQLDCQPITQADGGRERDRKTGAIQLLNNGDTGGNSHQHENSTPGNKVQLSRRESQDSIIDKPPILRE